MTLDQLRIFVAVAEREHVTAAARALNVTQSTASAAITALEARHRVKLFHRVGRGIALTDAGRVFLDEARGVLARASVAELALGELGGLKRGTLRLVASQTIAAYWLPPILAAFQEHYPQLSVELGIGNTSQAAARVQEGAADLGFVEGLVDDPALAIWAVGGDRLLLVRSMPWSGGAVGAADLAAMRWVMREAGSGTRSNLEEALRRVDVDPSGLNVVLTLPSNESVRTAVEAGAGTAALSALVVEPSVTAERLAELPFDLGRRSFFALRHKERYRSRAADALLELVAERRRGAEEVQAGAS